MRTFAARLACAGKTGRPAAGAGGMRSRRQCCVILLAVMPLAHYVRLRGYLLPAVITHGLFNAVGILVSLAGLP